MSKKCKLDLGLTTSQPFYVARSFRAAPFPRQIIDLPMNQHTNNLQLKKGHRKGQLSQPNFNYLQQIQRQQTKQWKQQHIDILMAYKFKVAQQIGKKSQLLLQERIASNARLKAKFYQINQIKKKIYQKYRHKCKKRQNQACKLCQQVSIDILNQVYRKVLGRRIKMECKTLGKKQAYQDFQVQNLEIALDQIKIQTKFRDKESIKRLYTKDKDKLISQNRNFNNIFQIRKSQKDIGQKKIHNVQIQENQKKGARNTLGYSIEQSTTDKKTNKSESTNKFSKLLIKKNSKPDKSQKKQNQFSQIQALNQSKSPMKTSQRNSIAKNINPSKKSKLSRNKSQLPNRMNFEQNELQGCIEEFMNLDAKKDETLKSINQESLQQQPRITSFRNHASNLKSTLKIKLHKPVDEYRDQWNADIRKSIKFLKCVKNEKKNGGRKLTFKQVETQQKTNKKRTTVRILSKNSSRSNQSKKSVKRNKQTKQLSRKNVVSRNKVEKRKEGLKRVKQRASIEQKFVFQRSDFSSNEDQSIENSSLSSNFSRSAKSSKKGFSLGLSKYQQQKIIFKTYMRTTTDQVKKGILKFKTAKAYQFTDQKVKSTSSHSKQAYQGKRKVNFQQQQPKQLRIKQIAKCRRKQIIFHNFKKVYSSIQELENQFKRKLFSSKDTDDVLVVGQILNKRNPLACVKRRIQKYMLKQKKLLQLSEIPNFYQYIQQRNTKVRKLHEQKCDKAIKRYNEQDKYEIDIITNSLDLQHTSAQDRYQERPIFEYFDIDLQLTQTMDSLKRCRNIEKLACKISKDEKQNMHLIEWSLQQASKNQSNIGQKSMKHIAKLYFIDDNQDLS